MIQKIKECENAYIQYFTEREEQEFIVRYRNPRIPDMYDHNFTYLKTIPCAKDLKKIVREELEHNLRENKSFCKMTMDRLPDEIPADPVYGKPEIGHTGAYRLLPGKENNWRVADCCEIRKIMDPEMVEVLLSLDMIHDEGRCGEDFCGRRAHCRGSVYLSDEPLNCYICYYNKIPVGNCDLLLHQGTAKIEDFAVLPEYQRRGIGTTILKHLVKTAYSQGADLVYLIADEEDTPKEMYLKMGFEKVSESYSFFWKL